MAFEMTDSDRIITIYNLSAGTNAFIGQGDGYIPAHTGLPAYCTDIAPPDAPAGSVAVFDYQTATWSLVEDHRGQTVYDTQTGQAIFIETLGVLPEGLISIAPDSAYMKWDGTAWVFDESAKQAADIAEASAKKSALMSEATQIIAPLADAKEGGYIDEDDVPRLAAWQKYRYALTKVDTTKPVWPDKPAA